MEDPRILPIQDLFSWLSGRRRRGGALNLGGGVGSREARVGLRVPDRLPGSAASMARPEDRSARTGTGTGSRAGGAQPRFPAAAAAAQVPCRPASRPGTPPRRDSPARPAPRSRPRLRPAPPVGWPRPAARKRGPRPLPEPREMLRPGPPECPPEAETPETRTPQDFFLATLPRPTSLSTARPPPLPAVAPQSPRGPGACLGTSHTA